MMSLKVTFVFAAVLAWTECQGRGVQFRLSEKGMSYAINVGIAIVKENLKKNIINTRGKSGRVEYSLQNLRINDAVFKNYQLIPVSGTGLRTTVSGIAISAEGKLWYKYKRGWFRLSDSIGVAMRAENINFDVTLKIGSKEGRPTMAVQSCSSAVGYFNLRFTGGKAWIYNLFKNAVEKKIKRSLQGMLCNLLTKEIDTKVKRKLNTIPVVRKFDDNVEIDYRLTSSPSFTLEYMDAYLKGEFKSISAPAESNLTIPKFSPSTDHSKHVYSWMTDYTINTAGEVYHKSGLLSVNVSAWDSKASAEVKSMLNTEKFGLLFPKLVSMYPNAPMATHIYSYKAPSVLIQQNQIELNLFAHAQFLVRDSTNKSIDVFHVKFDVVASGAVGVKEEKIYGKIESFDYVAKVYESKVGKPVFPLDSSFIKMMIETTMLKKANILLRKGFPLPKIDVVSLTDVDVLLQKNVIRIGTNIKYIK